MKANLYSDSYNRISIGQVSLHSLIDIAYQVKTGSYYRSGKFIVNNDDGEPVITQFEGYTTDNEPLLGDSNFHVAVEKDHFNSDQINLVIDFIDGITSATIDIYELKQIAL
ncbi:MAG: hypothetical protein PHX80_04795 [Candidatus Nanoarchaeia archaeon]|nr:hypothetical protein [Candidatus Nanoarchaeia archaeon]